MGEENEGVMHRLFSPCMEGDDNYGLGADGVARRGRVGLDGFGLSPSAAHPPNWSAHNLPSLLILMLINARSTKKTWIAFINDLILDEEVDLVCITETWAGTEKGVALSQVLAFAMAIGEGGGIALINQTDIPLTMKPVQQQLGLEHLHFFLGDLDRWG